ncbi:hypothetical protein QFZ28_003862 [Neobacillus niacini]|nr:hypothetical protein [Neobacillus niacini]MDQ1003462.1 hypothetical protein [Neobacillus niacini]
MADQTKRKGRKTVTNRGFLEGETKQSASNKLLTERFETLMRAKELKGLI